MDFLAHLIAAADRSVPSSPISNVFLFLGVGLVLRLLGRGPHPKGSAGDAAARLAGQKWALDSGPHEFGPVRVHDFRWLDEGYYDATQRQLEGAGFRCFGDVENLSVSAVFPESRTAIRDLASSDGVVVAFVWQIKDRNWLRMRRGDVRAVELETGFSDGTFLSTTNHPQRDRSGDVPGIERIQVPNSTPIGQLVAAHRARVAGILAEKPGTAPVMMRTHRELRRAAEHAHALRCEGNARAGCGAAGYCGPAAAGQPVSARA